jgi:ribosome biogenesis GTPase
MEIEMSLEQLGWNDEFERAFETNYGSGYFPARISLCNMSLYRVLMQDGEFPAVPTGKLLYGANDQSGLPVVGDWVATQIVGEMDPTITIHGVLPRKSALCRKEAGVRTQAQVLAANIDTLFLMVGLDGNYSLNRVERYLTVALHSGANPVVLLTKSDLRDDFLELEKEAKLRSNHEQIFTVSSLTGFGMEALAPCSTNVRMSPSTKVEMSPLV